jgi:hypothetical protein
MLMMTIEKQNNQQLKQKEKRDQFTDHPIITYTNRVQHQMEHISFLLPSNTTSYQEKARAIRMLIANLPPSAKNDLKHEYQQLVEYSKNEYLGGKFDIIEVYSNVSDWIYSCILQDAFRAIPLYRGEGTLQSTSQRYSDKLAEQQKVQGLGV